MGATALALIGFLIGGFIVSMVCNEMLLRFSQSLGIRNKNDVIVRWSNESKPSLGGISFFIAFLFGTIAYAVLFTSDSSLHNPGFSENIFRNREFVGLMLASVLAFGMGLSDDAYNTRPLVKLAVQITCAIILIVTNTMISVTGFFWIDATITIIWVVAVMNSLNMLDNMDGITGTTVLSILFSCLASEVILWNWNMNIWSLTLLTQIGALLGFLRFNLYPSRLFMGDAGSQFIGLFTAFFAIHHLWSVGETTHLTPWTGLFVTLIAFTPAFADTLTVVINRLRKGKSPMVGGKDHTTHHLVYAGLNDKQVWLVFAGIGLLSSLVTVLAISFARWGNPWMAAFLTLFAIAIFVILFQNTLVRRK